MAERSWNELVAEGKQLAKRQGDVNWALGDLALEVAPIAANPHSGSGDKLRRFAEEIEVEYETLIDYRRVAEAWPSEDRSPDKSWSIHQALRNAESRRELIKSVTTKAEAYRALGRAATAQVAPQRVEQARQLLADPEVARSVMADPQVRHVVDEARPAEDREEQARRLVHDPVIAEAIHRDPKAGPTLRRASAKVAREVEQAAGDRQRERAPELVNRSVIYEIAGMLGHARRDVNGALDRLREIELDDDYREMLKEEANDVQMSLGWLVSFLESGDRSFESALNRLLEEGE